MMPVASTTKCKTKCTIDTKTIFLENSPQHTARDRTKQKQETDRYSLLGTPDYGHIGFLFSGSQVPVTRARAPRSIHQNQCQVYTCPWIAIRAHAHRSRTLKKKRAPMLSQYFRRADWVLQCRTIHVFASIHVAYFAHTQISRQIVGGQWMMDCGKLLRFSVSSLPKKLLQPINTQRKNKVMQQNSRVQSSTSTSAK